MNIFDYSAIGLTGEPVDLSQYKGKVLLIVNTASACGFTPQYKGLEQVYRQFRDQGVVVLGFPCNQFGGQEPGDEAAIGAFCEKNYGVTFPLFSKVSVKGADAAPLYKFLADKKQNGAVDSAPSWNFCKYLVDENGRVVKFYKSGVQPLSPELLADIAK